MKTLLIVIVLLVNSSFTVEKTRQPDLSSIIGHWVQGKIIDDTSVIKAEPNRGGFYRLEINGDSTVIFRDAFNCGFGASTSGTWKVNSGDSTIIMNYTTRKGYYNNQNATTEIFIEHIYKIILLKPDELILKLIYPLAITKYQQPKVYAFIRNNPFKEK